MHFSLYTKIQKETGKGKEAAKVENRQGKCFKEGTNDY